jgi:hypothetical protein
MPPDKLAELQAALTPYTNSAVDHARQTQPGGARERHEAHELDGLLTTARAATTSRTASSEGGESGGGSSDGPRPPATVIVHVDYAALLRGYTQGDEQCRIDGLGPIPVPTATAYLPDAFLTAVTKTGIDIKTVTHLGRTVTAHQRTALIARDPKCVVPGCPITHHLEIDHVDGWALTHRTHTDHLARLCPDHHHQKTYLGATLTGTPGNWHWTPPPPTPPNDP